MKLEERILRLEERIFELEGQIKRLEAIRTEEFLTPKEVAKRLHCTVNTIYIKVRTGEIESVRNFGGTVRIPVSQFSASRQEHVKSKKEIQNENLRNSIFSK